MKAIEIGSKTDEHGNLTQVKAENQLCTLILKLCKQY